MLKQQLKVIYVSHLHPPSDASSQNIGGMQTTSMQLLNELKRRRELSVIPILLESPWKGIEIRTFWFLVKLYFTLPEIVKREKADIILCSSMVTGLLSLFVRSRISVPMVTIVHGQDVTLPFWLYQKLLPRIFKNLNGAILISEATRKASIDRGLSSAKGIVIPNGMEIQPRHYDKSYSRQVIEKEFNLDLKDKYLLLSVGRQVKRKGHAWFIEEVLPLIENDVVYLLIGQGKEHQNLQDLKQKSPCGDRIILAGAQPQELLGHAYDAADIFIMPNIPVAGDLEGFGVVMLEANEARTPVVASDLEGIRDVIQNGINGYRVPPYDNKLFARIVDDLLDCKLDDLCESSYNLVTRSYTWKNLCDRYVRFLKQMVNSQGTVLQTPRDRKPSRSSYS
ncbi:MAG TPA: glycosyltransferase family 4 protein [Oscillatoriales cyanobacterium M59_W2019_021]|nr:glycosyltransferase family 4 protein [Oscillatoriales cyanobacterium M4454_W2019_049]HIK49964.1 glycosyltransferase family 4 protein [Oscillatoriales cyanobacterium M59_W2019_021]